LHTATFTFGPAAFVTGFGGILSSSAPRPATLRSVRALLNCRSEADLRDILPDDVQFLFLRRPVIAFGSLRDVDQLCKLTVGLVLVALEQRYVVAVRLEQVALPPE
jgi:hypothetical protein